MQAFYRPTMNELLMMAIDISEPRYEVEVTYSAAEDRLWVNVDGVCILRIQRMSPGVFKIARPNGS